MADLPNLINVTRQDAPQLTHIVVLDHASGTDIWGVDVDGNPVTGRFSSPGNLPWGSVLGLARAHSTWSFREPGVEEIDPDTGDRRYRFTIILD